MFCLLFWEKEKSKSVLEEDDHLKDKEEGEKFFRNFDGKEYSAILLKRSEDKKYLEKLYVTKTGEILKEGKRKAENNPTLAEERKIFKEKSKMLTKKKEEIQKEVNKTIFKLAPAFPTTSEGKTKPVDDGESSENANNEIPTPAKIPKKTAQVKDLSKNDKLQNAADNLKNQGKTKPIDKGESAKNGNHANSTPAKLPKKTAQVKDLSKKGKVRHVADNLKNPVSSTSSRVTSDLTDEENFYSDSDFAVEKLTEVSAKVANDKSKRDKHSTATDSSRNEKKTKPVDKGESTKIAHRENPTAAKLPKKSATVKNLSRNGKLQNVADNLKNPVPSTSSGITDYLTEEENFASDSDFAAEKFTEVSTKAAKDKSKTNKQSTGTGSSRIKMPLTSSGITHYLTDEENSGSDLDCNGEKFTEVSTKAAKDTSKRDKQSLKPPGTNKGETKKTSSENTEPTSGKSSSKNSENVNSEKGTSQGITIFIPTVSEETVVFVENLAGALRGKLEGKTSSNYIQVSNSFGQGSSKIAEVRNGKLYLNPRREAEITRFRTRPEEMIRRLMLELVGAEELRTMTALGQSRKGIPRKAIPSDIRNAVHNFIKEKHRKYTYEKFIDVLNNQCCTLRNPKNKIQLKVQEKDEEEKVRKDEEDKEESDSEEKSSSSEEENEQEEDEDDYHNNKELQ